MAGLPCPEKLCPSTAPLLGGLAGLMHTLSEEVPPRTAIRQIEALFHVAHASAMGQSITLKDVVEAIEPDGGARALERSIHQFTSPSRHYPDALDWIRQELDPEDRRKKYLVLTPVGVAALMKLLGTVQEANPERRAAERYPKLRSGPGTVVPARLVRKPSGIWRVDFIDPASGKRHRLSCRTRDRQAADAVARRIVFQSLGRPLTKPLKG